VGASREWAVGSDFAAEVGGGYGDADVVAGAAVARGDLVGAAVEDVVAEAAEQAVVAGFAEEFVAGATGDGVGAVAAVDDVVCVGAGDVVGAVVPDQVVAVVEVVALGSVVERFGAVGGRGADAEGVRARRGRAAVVVANIEARAAVDDVLPAEGAERLGVSEVVRAGLVEVVVTGFSGEVVGAGPADERVVARAALEDVIARSAVELVVGGAAGDGVVAVAAEDDLDGRLDVVGSASAIVGRAVERDAEADAAQGVLAVSRPAPPSTRSEQFAAAPSWIRSSPAPPFKVSVSIEQVPAMPPAMSSLPVWLRDAAECVKAK
jgi:hypothetical protein